MDRRLAQLLFGLFLIGLPILILALRRPDITSEQAIVEAIKQFSVMTCLME
jgi:formate-dependent nitrite reductase membrane component NrfD